MEEQVRHRSRLAAGVLATAFLLACTGASPFAVGSQGPAAGSPPGTLAISPTSASIGACQTVTFTASAAATWSVQEGASGGSISSGGAYTAPSVAGLYHVVGTSAADTSNHQTATVTVVDKVLSVAVDPTTVDVQVNGPKQFTATVTTTCGAFTTSVSVSREGVVGASE